MSGLLRHPSPSPVPVGSPPWAMKSAGEVWKHTRGSHQSGQINSHFFTTVYCKVRPLLLNLCSLLIVYSDLVNVIILLLWWYCTVFQPSSTQVAIYCTLNSTSAQVGQYWSWYNYTYYHTDLVFGCRSKVPLKKSLYFQWIISPLCHNLSRPCKVSGQEWELTIKILTSAHICHFMHVHVIYA